VEQNGHRFIRIALEGDRIVVGGDRIDAQGVTDLSPDSIYVHLKKESSGVRLFEDMLCKSVHKYWGETRADGLIAFGSMVRRRIPPLSTARRKAILAAHKAGYTEDDMKTAVRMVMESDFHLENGYTDLTLILRDTKIETYLSWAAKEEKPQDEIKELNV
jgi:hypothetical protein